MPLQGQAFLLVGCGKEKELGLLEVREILAAAASKCREMKIRECSVDISRFAEALGKDAVLQGVLGLELGSYTYSFTGKEEDTACSFQLERISDMEDMEGLIAEAEELVKGIRFARDTVNTPGNHLRPMDFDRCITGFVKDVEIEAQTFVMVS